MLAAGVACHSGLTAAVPPPTQLPQSEPLLHSHVLCLLCCCFDFVPALPPAGPPLAVLLMLKVFSGTVGWAGGGIACCMARAAPRRTGPRVVCILLLAGCASDGCAGTDAAAMDPAKPANPAISLQTGNIRGQETLPASGMWPNSRRQHSCHHETAARSSWLKLVTIPVAPSALRLQRCPAAVASVAPT